MIGLQCKTLSDIISGPNVRKDIRAPKRINGLLRVTHQKDRMGARRINCFENFVLNRIGILELVKHRNLVRCPYFFAKRLPSN